MKHTMIKMLSLAMALIMIVSTMASVAVFAVTCDHANAVAGETFAPTCKDYGYTLYHCPDCGEDFAADVKAKVGHKLVSVNATDATCEADATKAHFACEWCKQVLNADGTVADDQDVEIDGTQLAHNYGSTPYIFAPTCDKKGYVAWVCSDCFHEEVIALSYNGAPFEWGTGEHDWTWEVTKLPTCKEDGTAVVKCTACPATYSFIIDKSNVDHDYEDKSKPATCTEKGFDGFVCKVCGKIDGTGELAALGHNPVKLEEPDQWFIENNDTDGILYTPASCLIEGWHYTKCSRCNAYAKVTEEIKDHQFDEVNFATEGVLAAAQSCLSAEQWTLTCETCNVAKKIFTNTAKPALGHDWVDVAAESKDATCTEIGYTFQDCSRCDETRKVNATAALGHNFVATYTCPACTLAGKNCDDCTHEGRVVNYICTAVTGTNARPGCGAADSTRVNADAKCAAHDFATSTKVVANCESPEFLRWSCANAGCAATKDDAPAAGAQKNADNHTKYQMNDKVLPNCTTDGYEIGQCEGCGNFNIRKDLPKSALDLTKAENHTQTGTVTYVMYATCNSVAITNTYYACCATTVTTRGTTFDNTKHGTAAYPADAEDKADVANIVFTSGLTFQGYTASCEAEGTHANYKCSACNKTFITSEKYTTAPGFENFKLKDEAVENCACAACTAAKAATGYDAATYAPANVVIAPLGHDYVVNNNVEGVQVYGIPATCTTSGYTDRKVCTRCDKVQAGTGVIIPAKGHSMSSTTEKDPTCTEKGMAAATFCTRTGCELYSTAAAHEIAALGHTEVISPVLYAEVDGYCTPAGFTVKHCTVCNLITNKVVSYIAPTEHDMVDHQTSASCTTDGKTWKECAGCGLVTDEKIVANATGHYVLNADGTKTAILTDCDKINAYLGQVCSGCGLDLAEIAEGEKTHNIVEVYLPATCVDNGVKYYTCIDCDAYFDALNGNLIADPDGEAGPLTAKDVAYGQGFIDAQGYHVPGEIKAYVPATTTVAGSMTFVCSDCGEDVVCEIPALGMEIVYNIAAKGYNEVAGETNTIVNTGDVKLIVGATTENYKFRALTFVFEIDAMTLDKVVLNYKFDATLGVEVDTHVEDGYLTVLLTATAGKNAVIEGTDVALFDIYLNAPDSFFGMKYFDLDEVECTYVEGDANFYNYNYDVNYDASDDVEVTILGDANFDHEINTGDVIAMMDIIYTAAADVKYNAAADINRDGKVDVVDFAMLKKFVMSEKLFSDYAELIATEKTYSVAETIANSYWLKAELTKYDLNEDGEKDANDTTWFIAYAEAQIETLGYEYLAIYGDYFEELVDSFLDDFRWI